MQHIDLIIIFRLAAGIHREVHRDLEGKSVVADPEGNSAISEVSQEDRLEGSEIVDQGTIIKYVLPFA